MDIYRVALFGHRDLCAHIKVEEGLRSILKELIENKPEVEIYIGRNGEFDIFTASVVKRVKKKFGSENITMSLILPYIQTDIEQYAKYYDGIIIPECVEKEHPKGAIKKRNRWMIEQCDLVVCYVERESGGAYNAMKYAIKLGKRIINLANGE